ncbi:thioredoxin family protein [Marinobacterium sp. D7]|uniref:thioredoxin family protein n=1 Tax=Marinobacterium ramblicola TaxID=2849041 RepID=UPI001C2DA514|nr:thioredoxin family protein [Marinobacterium ramblicola]MBV1788542.1 thioredoxin family protein [Marinobacterium ramblicola]
MALTPSTMIALGHEATEFNLLEPKTGRYVSSADLPGPTGLLVLFICNHCPFVRHIEQGLIQLGRDYAGKGIDIVAISSNDAVTHPEDGPDRMAEKDYPFPYLYDESQQVAKAYDAACTPDLFLFDGERELVYRGQFDDARPGNDIPVTGKDLRAAMDALLAGKNPAGEQKPSIGCNIKWRTYHRAP